MALYLYWNNRSGEDEVIYQSESLEDHARLSLQSPPTDSYIDRLIYRSMDSRPLYEVEEKIEDLKVEEKKSLQVEQLLLGGGKEMRSQDSIWDRGELPPPPIIGSSKEAPPNIAIPDYGKLLQDSRGAGRRAVLDYRGAGRRAFTYAYKHTSDFLSRDRSEGREGESEKLVPDLSLPDPTQITKDGVVQQIRGVGDDMGYAYDYIYDFFTKDRSETHDGGGPV